MLDALKIKAITAIKILIAFAPLLISIYILFWLESTGTWTSETPHRGKLSVLTLMIGMGLSFLIQSYFMKPKEN